MSKSNIIFSDLAHFRPIMQVILLDIRNLARCERTSISQNTLHLTFARDIYAPIKSAKPPICAAAEVEMETEVEVEWE